MLILFILMICKAYKCLLDTSLVICNMDNSARTKSKLRHLKERTRIMILYIKSNQFNKIHQRRSHSKLIISLSKNFLR